MPFARMQKFTQNKKKHNTVADKLLIIPSIAGLTRCKDLPKFVKK
jgi:hypothetical protein